jgi:4-hydroxy-tetrahydrodipicolinate synthase
VAQVGFSVDLIDRLVRDFPKTVVGIKDSSGDWENTKAMLDRQWDDFRVFVGSESFLLANMRNGGAGCISATANINPAAIDHLYQTWQADDADDQQAALNDIRGTTMVYPMIPALKATVAEFSGDDQWRAVRPPLTKLAADKSTELARSLRGKGFDMPGL